MVSLGWLCNLLSPVDVCQFQAWTSGSLTHFHLLFWDLCHHRHVNKFWGIRDCIEEKSSTQPKVNQPQLTWHSIRDAWMSSSQEQPSLAQIIRAASLSQAQFTNLQKHKLNKWLLFEVIAFGSGLLCSKSSLMRSSSISSKSLIYFLVFCLSSCLPFRLSC